MPSFIFQLASTALAFAALQIPTTTAAPVKIETINIHRSLDAEALAAQLHAAAASTVEVRQYHNIFPVMRTMSRDEYYFSTVSSLSSVRVRAPVSHAHAMRIRRCRTISTTTSPSSQFLMPSPSKEIWLRHQKSKLGEWRLQQT